VPSGAHDPRRARRREHSLRFALVLALAVPALLGACGGASKSAHRSDESGDAAGMGSGAGARGGGGGGGAGGRAGAGGGQAGSGGALGGSDGGGVSSGGAGGAAGSVGKSGTTDAARVSDANAGLGDAGTGSSDDGPVRADDAAISQVDAANKLDAAAADDAPVAEPDGAMMIGDAPASVPADAAMTPDLGVVRLDVAGDGAAGDLGGDGAKDAPASDGAGDVADATAADLLDPDVTGDAPTDAPADVAVTVDAPVDLPPDLAPDVYVPPPDAAPPTPTVVFSEVMYHAVQDEPAPDRHLDPIETHEYLELHNRAYFPMNVSGWTIAGDVTFTFPAGTIIPPGGYLVVARNMVAFQAVYGNTAQVVGDYVGKLDNGGGTVELRDAGNALVESLTYDDDLPWPMGGDALGAGAAWLGMTAAQYDSHRFKGRSIERFAFDLPASNPANWTASPLDGMTPGAANSVAGLPPRIVTTVDALPTRGIVTDPLVRAADTVDILVSFSTWGTLMSPEVEWFVDDLAVTGEAATKAPLTVDGNGQWRATLPARPDNSIVRYRILGDRGAGSEVISPRPSDPYAWHAYFVSPVVSTTTPLYQLFIAKAAWTTLGTNVFGASNNINSGNSRVNDDGCTIRESWDARQPSVLVHQGKVYDVFSRYQGSRWNRRNGANIPDNLRPPIFPDTPAPLRALSWNVAFPRYAQFEGKRRTVILNKLNQSCPGVHAGLGQRLYTAAGIPVSERKYVRFHVNGAYYHTMMDIEHVDEDMMNKHAAPGQGVGDLFKSVGLDGDEGPFGWGDERLLPQRTCTPAGGGTRTWTALERAAYTYDRKTQGWRDNSDLLKLMQDMNTARGASNAGNGYMPLRDFFNANFDADKLTSYIAVRNWSGVWDDYFQNHFLWRRDDGKWLVMPWDLDLEFGGANESRASYSFYLGEQGEPTNRGGWTNELKDNFIKAFRAELRARIILLAGSVLSPANVKAQIDAARAELNLTEAQAAPAGLACDPTSVVSYMKAYADDRDVAVKCVLDNPANCGSLKGEYFNPRSDLNATTGDTVAGKTPDLTRNDTWVSFDWGNGSPGAPLGSDDFAVRWTGKIIPQYTEAYTFYSYADDGMKIWVNGTLLVDDWSDHAARERASSMTINLTAGIKADIKVAYYENGGGAVARVLWSSPSQPKQVIPPTRLEPAP
jgi:hypothetical protein